MDTFVKGTQAALVNMILDDVHNHWAHAQEIGSKVIVGVIIGFVSYAEIFCLAFWENESILWKFLVLFVMFVNH